jgi:uncharacterized membrane protein YgaE (UPF0421/DUF939 family)
LLLHPFLPVTATPSPTAHALRVSLATTLSLLVMAWFRLDYASLGAFTTWMSMIQYPVTIFQRGLERLLGRIAGILLGLGICVLFPDRPIVCLLLEGLAAGALFYVYYSGRLAYTFLNAGLYVAAIVEIGHSDPAGVTTSAWRITAAVAVGVVVADLFAWFSGMEHNLQVEPGGQSLLPLRPDWLNRSAVLVVTLILTQIATRWLRLPTEKAVISVLILMTAPDLQALVKKGELRLLGAFLGGLWALVAFVLLGLAPWLVLLAGLVFLGEFLAGYLARASTEYGYAGVQMGLVIPLVLVVNPNEFGSIGSVFQRLEGIVVAIAMALLVGGLWPLSVMQPPGPAPK